MCVFWTKKKVWNCTLLCWTIEFPIERRRPFCGIFDESIDCIVKANQVDLQFWDSSKGIVAKRYYSSEFLGKSSANEICSHFKQCLGLLEKEKLLHVSSDVPIINLLFLKVLTEKCKDKKFSRLIDLVHRICILHIMSLSMEKKLQIGNSKNWCYLWEKYFMKHLKDVLITKLLLKLRRRITPMQLILTGELKMMWLQKEHGWYGQTLLK